MSFAGDLEHLPIVDIIQLLHSTRKTGTLCLKSQKGESQLVFNDGYIVSANHLNNSPRIGQILVEMHAISPEEVEHALSEQKRAGANRRPLIATLIEGGKIKKEEAFRGLETLIEMTIVEVLTWTKGTFSLDVDTTVISDEYRYFPEKLKQDIHLDTQSVLMDALRIYDEKMRDGALTDGTFGRVEEEAFDAGGENTEISVDDLGLGDLDTLERKIPTVFSGLKFQDPAEIHRRVIGETLQDMPSGGQERLVSFLTEFAGAANAGEGRAKQGAGQAVILFSRDEFMKHSVTALCRYEGYFVFTTDAEETLDLIINQSLSKELAPILVMDATENGDGEFTGDRILTLLQQKNAKYPEISILLIASPLDSRFSLQALRMGARAVLPRPGRDEGNEAFVEDTIQFLKTFRSYLEKSVSPRDREALGRFKVCFRELDTLKEAAEVSFLLLRFASAMFTRVITFVVGKSELIAERGIGVKADKSAGPTPAMRFRIPLAHPSIFRDTIESGLLFYGQCDDAALKSRLFPEIGAPYTPKILLAPVKISGRVIALTYGDFGPNADCPVEIDLMDILARHAGLVLENAFQRRKLEKSPQS